MYTNFRCHWATLGWGTTKKLRGCFYETQCSVRNCRYRRPYTTKDICQYSLFCQNSGHDVFNSIIRWHPASIKWTCDLDPGLVLEPRLLFETLPELEVLWYVFFTACHLLSHTLTRGIFCVKVSHSLCYFEGLLSYLLTAVSSAFKINFGSRWWTRGPRGTVPPPQSARRQISEILLANLRILVLFAILWLNFWGRKILAPQYFLLGVNDPTFPGIVSSAGN